MLPTSILYNDKCMGWERGTWSLLHPWGIIAKEECSIPAGFMLTRNRGREKDQHSPAPHPVAR
ncbi:MAG: hypothetical protein Q7T80_01030 [Methanoregula sp.]|nr:hypothetical protein [Methanoregula sp.]